MTILRDPVKSLCIEPTHRKDHAILSDIPLPDLAEVHMHGLLVQRLALQPGDVRSILVVSADKCVGSIVHSLRQQFEDHSFHWLSGTFDPANITGCYRVIAKFLAQQNNINNQF